MVVEYLKNSDFKSWDEFVENSPQGSIFAKSWYLDALGVDYKILVVKDKNILKAGIVLAKNEIKTYANPMLDKYLGIMFAKMDGGTHKVVSNQYKCMELILDKIKNIATFDYYFHPAFDNWTPLSWAGFTQQSRYTYRIENTNKSLEEIRQNYHTNIKRNIKNAIKNGVTIKRNIPFEELWQVVNKTFLRQGSKAPFNKEKLRRYISILQKRGNFTSFGAYDNQNRCVAILGLVYDSKSSYLLLNGIDVDIEVRGANAFIIDESIKYFYNICNYYDFEGSMLPGIEQFYRRFGGELTSYMRIWNDNFFNFFKTKAKKIYKQLRYGR